MKNTATIDSPIVRKPSMKSTFSESAGNGMGFHRICCGVSFSLAKSALTNGWFTSWYFSCTTGGKIRYSQLPMQKNKIFFSFLVAMFSP